LLSHTTTSLETVLGVMSVIPVYHQHKGVSSSVEMYRQLRSHGVERPCLPLETISSSPSRVYWRYSGHSLTDSLFALRRFTMRLMAIHHGMIRVKRAGLLDERKWARFRRGNGLSPLPLFGHEEWL
jgi:hypothetical protein